MWRLTGNSSLPIYLQIVDLIETKIMNGELLPEENCLQKDSWRRCLV